MLNAKCIAHVMIIWYYSFLFFFFLLFCWFSGGAINWFHFFNKIKKNFIDSKLIISFLRSVGELFWITLAFESLEEGLRQQQEFFF